MTLHDVVYVLVGVLSLYIGWLLLRLCGIRRHRRKDETTPAFSEAPSETIHSQILGGDSSKSFSSVFYDGTPAIPVPPDDLRPEPHLSRPLEPDASQFGFDALLEMRQTRARLDELQVRHEALQTEVAQLRDVVAELRAASQVSPVYGEAVMLARRGYDAQAIAERCGISVAEASLVRSLSGEAEGEEDHAGS